MTPKAVRGGVYTVAYMRKHLNLRRSLSCWRDFEPAAWCCALVWIRTPKEEEKYYVGEKDLRCSCKI